MSEKMIPFAGAGRYRLANGQTVNLSPSKRCQRSDKIQSGTGLCLDWVWEEDGSIRGLGSFSDMLYLVEKLPDVKYYNNPAGWLDNTAYIVREGKTWRAMSKSGVLSDAMEWDSCRDKTIADKRWIEITEGDALKLLGADAPKKEAWPKYFVGIHWGESDAYVQCNSPTSYFWVNKNGVCSSTCNDGDLTKEHLAKVGWEEVTKEDALKRVAGTKSADRKADFSKFIKKEEVTMEKATAIKVATGVAKFAGKWGWRTINYWAFEPATEVVTKVMRAVRYVTLTGAIVGGVYAYNNPDKAVDLLKSCLPKITIESPEIMG